ncbi:unnamed protein product [Rotaria socialis]|uniref:ethanolamine kinase n=1 Tax=Rotaria socialis TaxID=392032 RepID=A0A820PHM7_9BILA|nr:unnamed protein product [Rotaria socialis]CAF4404660.1 unnamed protein product [Rotaria socialis]
MSASAKTTIPYEAVIVDVNSLEIAGRLICSIKQRWTTNKLVFKNLNNDDHLVRYVVFLKDNEDEESSVILRIYPTSSDVYTDHQEQLRLLTHLAQHQQAPHILLTFTNGYFSSYIQGKILDIREQRTHELIAQKMAKLHSIPIRFHGPQLPDKLMHFIDLFTSKNLALHDRLLKTKKENENSNSQNSKSVFKSLKTAIGFNKPPVFPLTLVELELRLRDTSWTEISDDIDRMKLIFDNNWSSLKIPTVLCINNMKINNFVCDIKDQSVSIIDFDHCSHNYYLIDIVSYFLAIAKDNYDTKYPARPLQKSFLIQYLKYSKLNLSTIIYNQYQPNDSELEYLCYLCDSLIAPIHLYWALWAFLQALLTEPTSTFDYVNYGKIRLAQYYKHRKDFFRSENHTEKDMPKF